MLKMVYFEMKNFLNLRLLNYSKILQCEIKQYFTDFNYMAHLFFNSVVERGV